MWLGLVAGDRTGGVGLSERGVFAGWDDRGGSAGGHGVMALGGVEGTVGGDSGDLLLGRDLIEQLKQYGRDTDVAVGEFGCTDLQCFLVNPLSANACIRLTGNGCGSCARRAISSRCAWRGFTPLRLRP